MIEDSTSGVQSAKAAGMKCVGYRNPGSGNQDLSKADIIVDDFSTDNTKASLEKLRDSSIKVFFHQKNRGKGAAIRIPV